MGRSLVGRRCCPPHLRGLSRAYVLVAARPEEELDCVSNVVAAYERSAGQPSTNYATSHRQRGAKASFVLLFDAGAFLIF